MYHNIPVDPAVGHDAILALLNMFMGAIDRLEFQVRNIAAVGDTVLTERVDVFHMPNGKIELPVMGTFEVQGREDRGLARLLRPQPVHVAAAGEAQSGGRT